MAAQYQTDFSGQTLGQPSSDFTPYAGATFATNEIVVAAASLSGQAWRVQPIELSATQRTFLSFDAVAADPDRDHFEAYVRARATNVGTSNSSFSLAGRMSGTRGSENLYCSYSRSSGGPESGLQRRTNGSPGTLLSGSLSILADGQTLHIKLRCVGDQISHKQWLDADPEPATWSTTTDASHADGEIGLFWLAWSNSGARAEIEIDYFAVSTGGLAVLMPGESPSTTPVAFTGTVPTLNGTESAAFSESVASYFSGTETPFSYAVHAGTLPAGLSLNTSTGVISGTPSAAGTASGIVIRATDATPDTADTNAFDIVIAAAGDVTPPVLSSPTGAATGQTTASGAVTTDEGNGTLYAVVTASATPPSAADIRAGTGAAYATSQAVNSTGAQNVSATGLTAATTYYWHFLHDDAAANASNVATSASFQTDAAPLVVKGVRVTTTAASVTGLTALWWDSNPPTGNPVFSTTTASTDGTGALELDLDASTTLDVGQNGTLMLYKLDATDHQDSLAAVTRLTIEDIA